MRKAGNPPTLARVPAWALLGGALAMVIIIVLVILVALPRGQKGGGAGNSVADSGERGTPTQPDPTDLRNGTSMAGGGSPNTTQRATTQERLQPLKPAKVWEPGTLKRDPKLYYVWVIGTPKEDMARKDAQLLAANGISASIERQPGGLYQVITEQGFASTKEAEGYIKRIRDIGKTKPEYKKTRRASEGWQDAYARPVRPPG